MDTSTSKHKDPHDTDSRTGEMEPETEQQKLEIASKKLQLYTTEKRDLKVGNESVALNIEAISTTDEEEHIISQFESLSLYQESTTNSRKPNINECNDSVTIYIGDCEHAAGDLKGYNKEQEIISNESLMQEIIHLDDDNPNHIKYNIQPPRTQFVYKFDMYSFNRVDPIGDEVADADDDSRSLFVALVFTVLLIMLGVTFGYVFFIYKNENLKSAFKLFGPVLYLLSFLLWTVIHYMMICSSCARWFPCNIICLFITVSCWGTMAASTVVYFQGEIILIALVATMAVVFICMLLAMCGLDLTKFVGLMCVLSLACTIGSAITMGALILLGFGLKTAYTTILIVSIILTIFSRLFIYRNWSFEYHLKIYKNLPSKFIKSMIMELQMIMGGKTVELGTGDWAMGAYMLYVSIIQLFIQLLRLISQMMDEED